MTPSITQDQVDQALGSLLAAILPASVTVIIGQINRVASPEGDYVVYWPLHRPIFSTNVETPADTKFTASIAVIDSNTAAMTTSSVTGVIQVNNSVFGLNVADSTRVLSQTSGTPGGAGVYVVSPSQAVSSETMSTGTMTVAQSTESVMQVDVHGPNSADNAQAIAMSIRSEFAVNQMDGSGVTPLFADEPRQAPFITAAKQYENRWVVDVHLQITPTVSTPQEFADAVTLTVVDVEVTYP